MTLDELPTGKKATIASVDWGALALDEAKRLQALGLDAGAQVSIAHRGVFAARDPLAVRIGSMTVAIRRGHARAIVVGTS
ncbi:FeoA family protein [Qipengyuania sediminis]|uniref:FeoA family protein n=1 Tax=Qipengyuania sediminis TaxID=1532023 RepID=UPI00105925A1|nr:FeoA family protein [Qipengyuania sediminis]